MKQLKKAIVISLLLGAWSAAHAELSVPANTAYSLPDPEGFRISRRGTVHWTNPKETVNWYGKFETTGEVHAKLVLRLTLGKETKLRLSLGDEKREARATGNGGDQPVTVDFGAFHFQKAGYQHFVLETLDEKEFAAVDLDSLVLDGAAMKDAHFNLKERRNAASVHMNYPINQSSEIASFYCEVTALEDPVWSYYMACGWHRGYFGMQVNSSSERRIIFSVWDSGKEPVSRDKVKEEDRVKLLGKGEGVDAGDFGNEGTGGHSHLVYPWKTGEKQRFLVTANPADATHTIYSGYYYFPDKKRWGLISSWSAPKDGSYLRRLHSFSEDFVGENGHFRRKALYGNQWVQSSDGKWTELLDATFSHDATGRADRFDRFMGVENGSFFLSHGGFVDGFTKFGDKFTRPAIGSAPEINLPGSQIN